LQGVFRGLQDAKTPFYATLACNALNIALEPPFIFKPLNLGVRGSALATTLAQILPLAALLLVLQRRYNLSFKGLDMHQLGAMFAPTGFLLLRTISISAVFAAATSLVARAGPLAAAAHQVGVGSIQQMLFRCMIQSAYRPEPHGSVCVCSLSSLLAD
jgi:MATE family multidrug resistance protein